MHLLGLKNQKKHTSLNLKSKGLRSFSDVVSFCRDLSSFWRPLTLDFLNLPLKEKLDQQQYTTTM